MFERWAGDPDFTRYLSWPVHRGVEDSRAFIERVIGAWRRRDGHLPWVIEDRMDGPIGSVGVTLDAHRVSLGMGIAPAWQGRGYATEAVRAVVEAALTDPNVHRLWAVCDPRQPRLGPRAREERSGVRGRSAKVQPAAEPLASSP